MNSRSFLFVGGRTGPWRVVQNTAIVGPAWPNVERLAVLGGDATSSGYEWILRGVTSNERYVERPEKTELLARQPALGRAEATHAALIPLRKSPAWWALTQDERRRVFEAESKHIQIGLKYLPAVARRLHHCRDLAEDSPFDFLTWFEFGPADAPAFDALVAELRATVEWSFVEREIDIRLVRD